MQDQNQPGWVFSPGQQAPTNSAPQPQPTQPTSTPQPAETTQPPKEPSGQPQSTINWTASEYVEHQKGASWYLGVSLFSALIIAAIYFITKEVFSVVVLAIFAVVFMVFGARKPRTLSYSLSESGIQIGTQQYGFSQFKSFSLIDEGSLHSIALLPLKRFMPPINVYFAPNDEKSITDFLADRLPYEPKNQDAVDRLMHKIGF